MNKITDDILCKVEKPSRYVGGELNQVIKNPDDVNIRFAFCFPDVYEVGMSHLGTRILYHTINERKDTYCERVFTPWPDMEGLMRENDIKLFSLETKTSLDKFDMLGFTLQYEMSYTNILNMLDMSGITIRSSERGEDEPIIMAGGPCAYNPEPLYDIVDFFEIGEGEEMMNDVLEVYARHKANGKVNKKEFLREISKIGGIYVPSLYDVTYNEDGTIKEFKPKYEDVPAKVKKRIVNDFDSVAFPDEMIVPYTEIVHDRVVLETARGCTNGCRFCQAGMIYRPVREKTTNTLLEQARKALKATGYNEVSLASLSICDYSNIQNLISSLILEHEGDKVGIALPSIRVDAFSVDLIKEIQKVRKTGLTFAPEAGSQRMRDIINKGLTEERILEAAKSAFESGWSTIKLYFILGLPYETTEDAAGIGELAEKMADVYFGIPKNVRNKGLKITVSTSILVPKPFTPFQWAPMARPEIVDERIKAVRGAIKSRSIVYNYHEQETSFMEAVFARGDRRTCDVLIKAFEKGAKFDGWSEYFKMDIWNEAMAECNLDPDFYVYRDRSYEEILPWDFIDIGVNRKYLERENEKAKKAELTRNCLEGCTGCGINVNFKEGKCFEGAIRN
ncbi:TIGR03960 family B12-binding radical SAM protein [uncultured Clostridium sp.]|uniref:TIGR03960 family B12-binding radical SAM protein n=1 Tax=uncultured Clostridium sp. TaxID=59620 RepID=UPI0025E861CF|nr:TIGR03960 family B12-binding radical SAM protein [uncultured Clostridium sp.]MDO5780143.1 TIGR03960 family B12-binding radical SAM protein [Clostridium sp.]MDU4882751.1 TIGR03960 family B12-binding radical SAM protein [Clostridium celatum]MDU7075979.1 TIGR03960 family B12-binding radical SAM protein [Clostridium celatum]